MNPYPSYKESGIEWIGEIPEGWDIIRTKFLTDNLDGRRVPLNSEERGEILGDYPYWGSNGVVGYVDDYLFDEQLVLVGEDGSPFFERYKDVSFFVDKKVWVNNHIHVLRNKDGILPKILVHSFNCVNYRNFITGSTRDKLNQSDLKNIPHPVPPIQEQQQISNYLDLKTQQIDSLIEKTQKKIEILKEKRTSLINHVVTKGLNPDVEMKDSGVEWIGEIPSHWIKKRVKYILFGKFQNGVFKKKTEFGSGSKLVNVIDLYSESNVINQQSLDRVKVDENELQKYKVNEGDIFFVRSSLKLEGIGVSSIINEPTEPTVFECHIVRGIPKKSLIHPYYLKYIMNCDVVRRKIVSISNTVTMTTISQDLINDIKLVLPPISEQQEIIDHLETETTRIDSTVEKETQRIELLKEYRQSLISDVVTGKVDVRDEVLV